MRRLDAKLGERDRVRNQTDSEPLTTNAPTTQRTVSEAVARFLKSHGEIDQAGKYCGHLAYGSWRKYRSSLTFFSLFCEGQGVSSLADVNLDALEDYRRARRVGLVTWKVELHTLRTFFGYCVSHKWLTTNPAKELKPPRNIQPNEVVPYNLREESEILAACDRIGGGRYERVGATYERLRARAMLMLLRHTALRVSDVCTIRKDAMSWDQGTATWRVLLRTQKSGEPVFLPIPESLKVALDILPLPRNAAQDCPYYFWNAQTSRRAVVGIAERTLGAVFKKSAVKGAHAHRFRHTLATRLLEQGATFEQVADILGNSPGVVRKHYGKWSKGRQANIDRLMFAHFQTASTPSPVTNLSHEKTGAVN
jgi:site-specific recombinase XerD